MSDPTVYEARGSWWFADETWGENGPYTSQEDAAFAQRMYVRRNLYGERPPTDTVEREHCKRLGIDLKAWRAAYAARR